MPFLLRREMRLGSITNQPALAKHTSLQQAAEEALGFLDAAMARLRLRRMGLLQYLCHNWQFLLACFSQDSTALQSLGMDFIDAPASRCLWHQRKARWHFRMPRPTVEGATNNPPAVTAQVTAQQHSIKGALASAISRNPTVLYTFSLSLMVDLALVGGPFDTTRGTSGVWGRGEECTSGLGSPEQLCRCDRNTTKSLLRQACSNCGHGSAYRYAGEDWSNLLME